MAAVRRNSRMTRGLRRSALFTVALVVAHTCGVMSQTVLRDRQDWGPASAGLRMAISSVASGPLPGDRAEFDVAIQNVGDKDVVLNLGMMLANGKVMFPQAIRLLVTDAQEKTRELHFSDKRYPGVAGRVDDYLVALRSGSSYVLRLNLEQYVSPAAKEFVLKLPNGRYRIAARFEGRGSTAANLDMAAVALMNFWKGTLQSNSFAFEVSGHANP